MKADAEPFPFVPEGWGGIALSVPLIAMLIASVAGLVGLLAFKRWGRELSLWSTLVFLVIFPFTGPVVSSGVGSSLSDLSMILWGAVLAVAYFGPIRVRFEDDAHDG